MVRTSEQTELEPTHAAFIRRLIEHWRRITPGLGRRLVGAGRCAEGRGGRSFATAAVQALTGVHLAGNTVRHGTTATLKVAQSAQS